jgi:hypothetical protein
LPEAEEVKMAAIEKERPHIIETYSTTDLSNRIGEVWASAEKGPVGIRRNRKTRYVVMPVDDFDRLIENGDPRRAYAVEELPGDLRDALIAEIDAQLSKTPR